MTAENTNSGAGNAPGTPQGLVLAPESAREPVATPERSGGALGALQDGGESAPAQAAPPAKRRPGKPPGYPKSGGRVKGTPNRCTVQTRDRISELADPIGFLADVMAGKRMVAAGEPGDMKKTWVYPTLAQRVQAGETLLRKLLPDLKAQELTGKDGAPLVEPTHRGKLLSTMEAARLIAFTLREGEEAEKELAELDAPPTEPIEIVYHVPEPEPEPAPEAPEPPVEPTEPALPKHPRIYIEEGVIERSGPRAWVAMEGRQELRVFHGTDARQKARDWVGTKFHASPAQEIEVQQFEDEVTA